MKKSITLALLLFVMSVVHAQLVEPVKFSANLKTGTTAEGEIVFSGKIDEGWHVYSTNLAAGGPVSATINVNKLEGVELVRKLTP